MNIRWIQWGILLAVFCLFLPGNLRAEEEALDFERDKGIPIYVYPEGTVKKAADDGYEEIKRFTMMNPARNMILVSGPTAKGMAWHILDQPEERRLNGVWLMVSKWEFYTDEDVDQMGELQGIMSQYPVPFFRCELKKGCQRFS